MKVAGKEWKQEAGPAPMTESDFGGADPGREAPDRRQLMDTYVGLLEEYLAEGGEVTLFRAYEFSRECVARGVGPEEVAALHAQVVAEVIKRGETAPNVFIRANDLLLETMMAYALSYRAALDAESRQRRRLQQYAEQLKQAYSDMETKDRTLEAVNRELSARDEQILRANERLKELDRLKSQFVLTVSHELRTPLTSILGFSEFLLAEEHEPDKIREYLRVIHGQAERISRLIEELLDLSRIEVGLEKLTYESADIGELVIEAVDAFRGATTHRFEMNVEPAPPVPVDRDKIMQVITNLLSNATKYSPKRSTVTVKSYPTSEGVEVSVRDRGIGIAHDEREHIFERFYRVEPEQGEGAAGTGLGLALVRALVELHGGKVSVRSRRGRGSEFLFSLPRAAPRALTEREKAA